MDIIELFWYLFHVEQTILKGNSITMQIFVFYFLSLQNKNNICTLSIKIILFALTIDSPFYLFLKLVHIDFIFSDKIQCFVFIDY